MHRLLPRLSRAIKLDTDLLINADVRRLHDRFLEFQPEAVMGLGPEQQPVYYCAFRAYREQTDNQDAGTPASVGGFQGFNTGVILLDFLRMRASDAYANATQVATLTHLQRKYLFYSNHLGDQDIYSMLGMEQPQLFYTLPCQWNRQLCTRYLTVKKFNVNLFEEYFHCEEPVYIYHGNCGTLLSNIKP